MPGSPILLTAGLALAALAAWGYCLVDLARTDESQVRTFSKLVWVLLLVFTSLFGAMLWLFAGRPRPG